MNENNLTSVTSYIKGLFGNSGNYPVVDVKSRVDGRTYKVRDLPDKEDAADLLAKLRLRLEKMMDFLVASYPSKPQVQRLKANFKPDPNRIFESTPEAEHTSYSVNKGEEVHFCLRERDGENEKLVHEDIVTFVAIHEMGHMITKTIGHGPDFWNNFAWLLQEAEKEGIYKHRDFRAHPVSYCGMRITDQPVYDASKDGTDVSKG